MKIVVFLVFVPAVIWGGYVFRILWGWFFVPIFGLPSLRLPEAIGIALVVGLLDYHYQHHPDDPEILLDRVTNLFFIPFECLILGWIVHLFM